MSPEMGKVPVGESLLQVKGFPRSGTHYIIDLLRRNGEGFVTGYNRHETDISNHFDNVACLRQFEKDYPKHAAQLARDYRNKVRDNSLSHVIIYKNLYDLIWSMVRKRRAEKVPKDKSEETFARDMIGLWDTKYRCWLGYRKLNPDYFHFVYYEDLLRDEKGELERVFSKYLIKPKSVFGGVGEKHLYGGGTIFRGRDYFLDKKYMDEIPPVIKDVIDRYETPVTKELELDLK
jgi:hypothetical protein